MSSITNEPVGERTQVAAAFAGGRTAHRPGAAVSGRRRKRPNAAKLWVTAVVLVAVVTLNLPLIQAIFSSVRTDGDLSSGPFAFAHGLTFSHYAHVISGSSFDLPHYYLNSVLISLGSVVLVVFVAAPGAYAIVRLGLGGNWLMRFVVSLRLLPLIFFALPFFLLFSQTGLLDTVAGLILANTFVNLPIGMLLFATAFQSIPIEIEEAAITDGCGTLRLLATIVFPLTAPAATATALLTFMFSWAEYLFALTLSVVDSTPVTVGAANLVSGHGVAWGDLSAVVVLSVLPTIVLATLLQRYLVSGMSLGAVKG